jgi:hypothetical protein
MSSRTRTLVSIKNGKLLSLLGTLFILAVIPITVYLTLTSRSLTPRAEGPAIRGSAGDMWADVIIGDRDFAEISNGFVNPQRVSYSGGAVVDRDTSGSTKGKLWLWSGAESRIVGVNLDNCPPATGDCTAVKVIGQPSLTDYAACNGDSSFQYFPNRVAATASTLCGVPESVNSFAENLSYVGMYSKNGNLYVPDLENHRVLIYYDPWSTDSVADEVIGQDNFSGNECNKTVDSKTQPIQPTASSLCLVRREYDNNGNLPGAGVALDTIGNLWVVDNANHRVLRFLKQADGEISKTADVAIGQANLTTGTQNSGSGNNKLQNPTTLRFDPSGNLYVSDFGNDRVMKYAPTEQKTNGNGTVFISGGQYYVGEVDTVNNGIWFTGQNNFNLALYGFDGTVKKSFFFSQRTVGSVGLGKDGSVTVSSPSQGTVYFQNPITKTNQIYDKNIFVSNTFNNSRLFGGNGVAVSGDQLFVTDTCRLLVWNNIATLTNGKPADYVLGATNFTTMPCNDNTMVRVKADKDNHVYVKTNKGIYIYNTPITASSVQPNYKIQDPIQTITGETLNFLNWTSTNNFNDYEGLFGITPQKIGSELFLWVSDANKHRVFRIRDPLGAPKVDVVIGQANLTSSSCNRGLTTPPVPLNYLCYPGSLSVDNSNNLYVSDHSLEVQGNHRILVFPPSLFPTNNTTINFDKTATKEFPNNGNHFAFETAFDSQNHMVMGQNSYSQRFFPYYLNPTDPNTKTPSGYFEDFVGMTYGAAFDSQDNLYVTDVNRSSVKIYKKPFVEPAGNAVPLATITSHQNDVWYKGGVHKLKADIHDDYKSIAKVEFLVDNNLIYTDYFQPFETDFNFSNSDGPHNVTVKAYDHFNRMGQNSITVKIDHQGPANTLFNSLANGATVSGTVPISFRAEDAASSVKKVEFYLDNQLVSTDTTNDSYGFWWNSSKVPNGSHTLTAKAYDQPENITTVNYTVNVNNGTVIADPTNQVYLPISGAGTYAEYSEQTLYPSSATAEFEALDEEVPDDLLSFVFTNGTNAQYRSSGTVDSTRIPSNARISSVEVWARAQNVGAAPSIKLMLRSAGVDYFSEPIAVADTNFVNYKKVWSTNPAGGDWTPASLANAQIGVQAWHVGGAAHRVTSVWMVVNYSEGKLGDINGDNKIDVLDLSAMLTNWGTNNASCDLNADGLVGVLDLSILLSRWGT